jgi:single-strand DNA-binding protein
MNINKVILIGYAGNDVDFKQFENDLQKASFNLATSSHYKNKNGELITETEWHQIVCWNKLATIVNKYVKKGSHLYLEGRISSHEYTDSNDIKRKVTQIVINEIQFLDKKTQTTEEA